MYFSFGIDKLSAYLFPNLAEVIDIFEPFFIDTYWIKI